MGEACYLLGKLQESIEYYGMSLSINEELHTAHPDDIGMWIALAEALGNFGDLRLRMGDVAEARSHLERALAIHREVLALDTDNIDQARNVAYDLHRLGTVEAISGSEEKAALRFEEARRIREEIFEIDPKNSERRHAQCSVVLRRTDPAAADTLVKDAVEDVRTAVAAGYRDKVTLAIDPDLLPLQSLPTYREIVEGIPAP